MIKHTLEISARPAKLKLKYDQLVLSSEVGQERTYACEDIGVLVLQHPAISLSSAVINKLLEAGAVVIFCNEKYLPSGVLLPVATHTEVVHRLKAQLEAGAPSRKQLWRQLVQAKILAQARQVGLPTSQKLEALAAKTRSGDPENCEAQAAKAYWPARFPAQYAEGIRRNPDCDSPFNLMLNYGYSVIRAAVARALVSAGLQPALGVHHKRRDNPFCLADDFMEPLRPLVDRAAAHLLEQEVTVSVSLTREQRGHLLRLLTAQVSFGDSSGPLMAVLPRYINSAYGVLTGQESKLTVPLY